MVMNYFGTSLSAAGHYFFTLQNGSMLTSQLHFNDIPFNPEKLPSHLPGAEKYKGQHQFLDVDGWSVLAIEGAPKDTRWGTHSVFFIKEVMNEEAFIDKLFKIPIAVKLLEAMPFPILFRDKSKAQQEANESLVELKESLTKENFWNELMGKYPKSMKLFCDFIDGYKAKNQWKVLFNWRYGILSDTNKQGDMFPKYHDLPLAMQIGIWLEFTASVGVEHRDFLLSFNVRYRDVITKVMRDLDALQ